MLDTMVNIIYRAAKILREEGFRELVKASISKFDNETGLLSFILGPFILFKVKKMSLEEILEAMFNKSSAISLLYEPIQVRWEIEQLLNLLKRQRPKYILEIGTARGGTLLLWTKIAAEDALIVSIDLPGGPFGGGYPYLKGLIYRLFKEKEQQIKLIRNDSHDPRTLEKVKNILKGKKFDFLFIDGDHTYDGVKKDFTMYSPLVRKGGIIAFHDIVPGPPELVGGVPKFWEELRENVSIKNQYLKHIEIVKDWKQKGYGIGILII